MRLKTGTLGLPLKDSGFAKHVLVEKAQTIQIKFKFSLPYPIPNNLCPRVCSLPILFLRINIIFDRSCFPHIKSKTCFFFLNKMHCTPFPIVHTVLPDSNYLTVIHCIDVPSLFFQYPRDKKFPMSLYYKNSSIDNFPKSSADPHPTAELKSFFRNDSHVESTTRKALTNCNPTVAA